MVLRGDVRAGSADRDAAVFRLREHYAAGRLTLAEFQDRLAAAYRAQTISDLHRLTSDLPADGLVAVRRPGPPHQGGGPQPAVPPADRRARGWARTGRRLVLGLGLATTALAAVVVLAALYLLHSGVLAAVLLALLALAAAGAAVLAGLIWIAMRIWRRAAWLEALPLLAGQPWLSRVVWAARVLWTGRTLWRLRGRFRLAPRA
jgi:Domain of unknown function (DUF1707)